MNQTPFLGKTISKLTLGTAQLGLQYGIANKSEKPSLSQAKSLLKSAYSLGITCFDTARSYGNSEEIIGKSFYPNLGKNASISVITKLSSLKTVSKKDIGKKISLFIQNSLKKLHTNYIDCLLLHNSLDILRENVYEILIDLKERQIIGGIGLSLYDPHELADILGKFNIDAVQLPFNLFDHRFYTEGLLEKLRLNDVSIFARSIFLQGLFFLPLTNIPKNLSPAIQPLTKLCNLSEEWNIPISQLAINFIRSFKEVTSMVIGSETKSQIKNNIDNFVIDVPNDFPTSKILKEFKNIPKEVNDPRTWEQS